jgi:Ca2+-binding RTX toxin-like protein
MTNVRMTGAMNDMMDLGYFYSGQMALTLHSGTSASFIEDGHGSNLITLSGEDFAYESLDIVSGEVDTVTFADAHGKAIISFDKLHLHLSQLPDLNDSGSFDANAFTILALRGNDRIVASTGDDMIYSGGGDDIIFAGAGDDWISGGHGNDRMTGGKGADFFEAKIGGGHDVVTDFDAIGKDGSQDLLSIDASSFWARKSGHDVVVHFGDQGDTVTLLNVDRATFSWADVSLTGGDAGFG